MARADAVVAAPTLRALLTRTELELRLANDPGDDRLDVPVRWVHSSDLADPTPFLSEDVVLLTTGTQFAEQLDPAVYVARLRERGVHALGFGTEVVRDGIPADLIAACADARLPLFEVPYRTPFIAVARAAAEAIAAQSYARRTWSLAAQRSLALAALRPDGFDATLAELSRQLGAWVGLYDSTGTRTHAHAPAAASGRAAASDGLAADVASADVVAAIDAEAAALLRRGAGTGASVRIGGHPVSLQTLGSGGRSGVLAVAGTNLDQDARSVVTAVAATTGLALEQRRLTAGAWSRLRGALVDLLAAGHIELVRAVASDAWGGFPDGPYRVALGDAATPAGARELLDRYAAGGRLFYGRDDDGVLLVATASDGPLLDEIAERMPWRLGVADAATADALPAARERARTARDHGGIGRALHIGEVPGDLIGDLAAEASAGDGMARARAEAVLEPVRAYDRRTGSSLETTLSAWLEHDGAHEATARALGVHRHTVRTRIATVQRLLGRDLTSFSTRASLWLALSLTR